MPKREEKRVQHPLTVYIIIILIGLFVFYGNTHYEGRVAQSITRSLHDVTKISENQQQPRSMAMQSTVSNFCEPPVILGPLCKKDGDTPAGKTTCNFDMELVGYSSCKQEVIAALTTVCTALVTQANQICSDAVKICNKETFNAGSGSSTAVTCSGSKTNALQSTPSCEATDPNTGRPYKYTSGPNAGQNYLKLRCSETSCSVYCSPPPWLITQV